jgi:hypothetical protein
MHPEIRSDRPGTCSKCGMKLEKVGQQNAVKSERKRSDPSPGK